MRFTGQTAIVSGGLGDIGRAIARRLASEGANLAIGDVLPASQATPLLKDLRALGVQARYDRVDVRNAAAVERWVARAAQTVGAPTLIIPNAAIVHGGFALPMPATVWQQELAVNLNGAFFLAQAAARRLVAQKQPGRIVFIGSWAAHAPHPNIPAYCAGKAALRMLMQCLALELSEHRIRVNEVAPGYVDAGLSGRWFKRNPADRTAAQARVPIHELVSADDVAMQVAHLCDPANTQMTGSVVVLDGGLSLVTPAAPRKKSPRRRSRAVRTRRKDA